MANSKFHRVKRDRIPNFPPKAGAPLEHKFLRGDVLLISLLILLSILLGFTIVGMVLAVGESQGEAVSLSSSTSRQAATACVEAALDKIGRDHAYAGNESLTVGSSTCMILAVVSSTTWTIQAESTVGNEISRQEIVLTDLAPVTIYSWIEVASF